MGRTTTKPPRNTLIARSVRWLVVSADLGGGAARTGASQANRAQSRGLFPDRRYANGGFFPPHFLAPCHPHRNPAPPTQRASCSPLRSPVFFLHVYFFSLPSFLH